MFHVRRVNLKLPLNSSHWMWRENIIITITAFLNEWQRSWSWRWNEISSRKQSNQINSTLHSDRMRRRNSSEKKRSHKRTFSRGMERIQHLFEMLTIASNPSENESRNEWNQNTANKFPKYDSKRHAYSALCPLHPPASPNISALNLNFNAYVKTCGNRRGIREPTNTKISYYPDHSNEGNLIFVLMISLIFRWRMKTCSSSNPKISNGKSDNSILPYFQTSKLNTLSSPTAAPI